MAPERKGVRVWSEVGLTLAVTDDPPQFIRFAFGHERIAKSDSVEEIRKTAALVDEFNEAELERRIKKYKNLVRRETAEDEPNRVKEGSVRERARRRLNDG